MWNDTEIPLAYLITFRCYGTWLHGDERGSVNRFRNQYKSTYLPPDKKWIETNTLRLKSKAVTLNAARRGCVEKAVRETCEIRRWYLHAINVRTNHIHAVVSIGAKKPESALNAFKANATGKMRESGCWQSEKSPWADKGSKRYLWSERSVALAVEYVISGQGEKLPDFDRVRIRRCCFDSQFNIFSLLQKFESRTFNRPLPQAVLTNVLSLGVKKCF